MSGTRQPSSKHEILHKAHEMCIPRLQRRYLCRRTKRADSLDPGVEVSEERWVQLLEQHLVEVSGKHSAGESEKQWDEKAEALGKHSAGESGKQWDEKAEPLVKLKVGSLEKQRGDLAEVLEEY